MYGGDRSTKTPRPVLGRSENPADIAKCAATLLMGGCIKRA